MCVEEDCRNVSYDDPTHHMAVGPGDLTERIRTFSDALGLTHVIV